MRRGIFANQKLLALTLFSSLAASCVLAQVPEENTGYFPDTAETDPWNADMFRSTIGTVSPGATGALPSLQADWTGIEAEKNGIVIGETLSLEPDQDARLFSGDRLIEKVFGEPQRPEAFGTSGAQYSSSGLYHPYDRFVYPFRAVGKLFFQKDGQAQSCTATVIRKNLILTAGHCLHSGNSRNDGYFSSFRFVPAYEAGGAPLGTWYAVGVWVTDEWFFGGGTVPNVADFGVIQVAPQVINGVQKNLSQVTDGFLGFSTNLLPNHTKKLGYPDNIKNGERLHQVDGQSHRRSEHSTVLFGSDMLDGSSGGPIIENFGSGVSDRSEAENTTPNRIVGVISFTGVYKEQKIQGSSQIGTSFVELVNEACRAPGAC